jgi:hypothetical protein
LVEEARAAAKTAEEGRTPTQLDAMLAARKTSEFGWVVWVGLLGGVLVC